MGAAQIQENGAWFTLPSLFGNGQTKVFLIPPRFIHPLQFRFSKAMFEDPAIVIPIMIEHDKVGDLGDPLQEKDRQKRQRQDLSCSEFELHWDRNFNHKPILKSRSLAMLTKPQKLSTTKKREDQ